jgi:hypothetical protein
MNNIEQVLPNVMVSSTGGSTAVYESTHDGITNITGGKRKRNKKTARKRRKAKRKSQKKIHRTGIKSFFY